MSKHLLLSFSSFHVASDPQNKREEEYAICYEQLLRVLPDDFVCRFIDNTTNDISDIKNERLKNALAETPSILYNNNVGETNKGLGELDMLVRAKKLLDFSDYKTISYLTGRRILTCPYVFDKTRETEKDAIMSNPCIYSIMSGIAHPLGENLYNDMFFSMSSEVMTQYCTYCENILKNESFGLGSEQVLYNFINEKKIDFEWIEHLGFIRNDWEPSGNEYTRQEGNAQWI